MEIKSTYRKYTLHHSYLNQRFSACYPWVRVCWIFWCMITNSFSVPHKQTLFWFLAKVAHYKDLFSFKSLCVIKIVIKVYIYNFSLQVNWSIFISCPCLGYWNYIVLQHIICWTCLQFLHLLIWYSRYLCFKV